MPYLVVLDEELSILSMGSIFYRKQNLAFPMKICADRPLKYVRLGVGRLKIG
jgi:hypothetical protein